MEDLQKEDEQFYYESHERITDQTWIDEPLKQLIKVSVILMFTKKKYSGLPVISLAIGAGVNYQTTRKVTDFALKYYQYKHLLAKKSSAGDRCKRDRFKKGRYYSQLQAATR